MYVSDLPDKGTAGQHIYRLKGGDGSEAEPLAEGMLEFLRLDGRLRGEIVVPAPSSKKASTSLAEIVAKRTNLILSPCLSFSDDYIPSYDPSITSKFDNAKGKVICDDLDEIEGKSVVLIDDIFTTGGVCHWSSKVLLENGATSVSCLVAGRATNQKHLEYIDYQGKVRDE